MFAGLLARLRSLILPASAAEGGHKPLPCRWCGRGATLTHDERGLGRYAQVVCARCDTRGPAVRFDPSDEWPHIAAERSATAKWDAMMRSRK